jgi:cob(I)alamin adenosyltransferase
MKLYTKTGDTGISSLYNGSRVPKSNVIFECLGDIDELNSNLGMLKAYYLSELDKQTIKVYNAPGAGAMVYRTEKGIDSGKYYEWFNLYETITKIQCLNMDISALIATPPDESDPESLEKWYNKVKVESSIYTDIESDIDRLDSILKPITNFVVPPGNFLVSQTHICRTITRRCERHYISSLMISNNEKINEQYSIVKKYLNRLSDYFFMLSRFISMSLEVDEDLYSKRTKIYKKI